MCDVYREASFDPKSVYKWDKHGVATSSLSRKGSQWSRKHMNSQVKKKFWEQQLVKKVMLTVIWNKKGPITIDFREKAATVNSTFYCQLL